MNSEGVQRQISLDKNGKGVSNTSTFSYLDPSQRPKSLKSSISFAFDSLSRLNSSGWGFFNGDSSYNICGVDEHALMKKIILQASSEQRDFYCLDLGAGDFAWSKWMAAFLDKQEDLPKDIKVHIIGIRGENNLDEEVVETDRCKIYNLGAFKVEELFEQFKQRGLNFENKIDLAVSRWCFRHLADPVGTTVQVYNLLRPHTGYLCLDGFFFLCNDETFMKVNSNIRMTRLFLDMKAPFLTAYNGGVRSLNHFIMRRPDDSPCRVPMSYLDSISPGDFCQVGSDCITRFERKAQEGDDQAVNYPTNHRECSNHIKGDKQTYDWLKENGLFCESNLVWQPLRNSDAHLSVPALHIAIENDDLTAVKGLIEEVDINESDSKGRTAMHIAIQRGSYDAFELLLKKGAMVGLYDGNRNTPLHVAALSDMGGNFLKSLIDAGADINANDHLTPLDIAIKAKNIKAVEILIKAKALISKQNLKDLDDPVFSMLDDLGIIPDNRTGNGMLADVCSFLKRGDCVVMHTNGENGIMYHYPVASNKKPKLFILDINPKSNLLNDDEWPLVLSNAGYDYMPYDADKIENMEIRTTREYKIAYKNISLLNG
ncbi:MAG: ankyrin repeat domain-containing protein [Verrucomicrobia bacterium]|nr:ankyrin repeat domain-containing protein [Verrucomicrobiota bacterium]